MFPIWVLNMDRSTERWRALQEQADRQQLTLCRWSATDGAALGLEKMIAQRIISPTADFLGLPNAAAIAGLCHSSFSIWKHLESEVDWVLILEDDVVLPDQFAQLINQSWASLPADAEVVLLGCDFWQRPTAQLDAQRFYQSVQPYRLPFWRLVGRVGGTFAYAVNKKGLRKLLAHAPFERAVDYFPYDLAGYLLSFHCEPHYSEGMAFYGVVQCSGATSTVQL